MSRAPLVAVLLVALAPAARAATVAPGLDATHNHHLLCLQLDAAASNCDLPPVSPYAPVTASHGNAHGLAVAPAVAEVRLGTQRVETVAADGFSARFAVVRGAGRFARFYDAGGTLIGAADLRARHLPRARNAGRLLGGRVRLSRDRELDPTPLQPDRIVAERCLSISADASSTASCEEIASRPDPQPLADDTCAPRRSPLAGFTTAARVDVVLGSGRRLALATRPALGARVYATLLPRGEAVRALIAGGRRVSVRLPPTARPCPNYHPSPGFSGGYVSSSVSVGKPAGPGEVVAAAGGRELRVGDASGPGICAGLDRIAPRGSCGAPPVDSTRPALGRSGGVVFGVLAADAATVELHLLDGTRRSVVPTGDGYTGRYAGRLRFLLVASGPIRSFTVRDASGRRIGRGDVQRRLHLRVVRRRRLLGATFTAVRETGGSDAHPVSTLCLQTPGSGLTLAGIRFPFVCDNARGDRPVDVVVRCGARRAVLDGLVPRGGRVRVRLGDGREIRPLVVRLGRAHAWIARPPRRARVVAVQYDARRPEPLILPAQAHQCGYATLHGPGDLHR